MLTSAFGPRSDNDDCIPDTSSALLRMASYSDSAVHSARVACVLDQCFNTVTFIIHHHPLHSSLSFQSLLRSPSRLKLRFVAAPRSHRPRHLRHSRPTSLRGLAIVVNITFTSDLSMLMQLSVDVKLPNFVALLTTHCHPVLSGQLQCLPHLTTFVSVSRPLRTPVLHPSTCTFGAGSQCLADLRVHFPRTLTSQHSRICACTFSNSTFVPTNVKPSPCRTNSLVSHLVGISFAPHCLSDVRASPIFHPTALPHAIQPPPQSGSVSMSTEFRRQFDQFFSVFAESWSFTSSYPPFLLGRDVEIISRTSLPKLEVASHDPASHATNVIVVGAFPALVAALCHGAELEHLLSQPCNAFPFFSLAFPNTGSNCSSSFTWLLLIDLNSRDL